MSKNVVLPKKLLPPPQKPVIQIHAVLQISKMPPS